MVKELFYPEVDLDMPGPVVVVSSEFSIGSVVSTLDSDLYIGTLAHAPSIGEVLADPGARTWMRMMSSVADVGVLKMDFPTTVESFSTTVESVGFISFFPDLAKLIIHSDESERQSMRQLGFQTIETKEDLFGIFRNALDR